MFKHKSLADQSHLPRSSGEVREQRCPRCPLPGVAPFPGCCSLPCPEPCPAGAALTELAGGGSGGGVDRGGGRAGFDPAEHGLAPVPPVRARARRLGGLLPVVVEGDQLPLQAHKSTQHGVRGTCTPGCQLPASPGSPGFLQEES